MLQIASHLKTSNLQLHYNIAANIKQEVDQFSKFSNTIQSTLNILLQQTLSLSNHVTSIKKMKCDIFTMFKLHSKDKNKNSIILQNY